MSLTLPLLCHFKSGARTPGNIYVLSAEITFEEVALPYTPATALFAPITVHTLLRSALQQRVISAFSTRGGSCWRGLFSEHAIGREEMWMSVGSLKCMAINMRINICQKFKILLCAFGFVHIQADSNGIWSAYDILMFPNWVLVGGTFMEDGVKQGYPQEVLERYCFYAQDIAIDGDHDNDDSATGSPTSSTASSDDSSTGHIRFNPEGKVAVREALVKILHRDQTSRSVFHALRAYFNNGVVELSRFEMELIARATGSFCYSACVSSAERFQEDFLRGSSTGDTIETLQRFLENEVDKDDRVNKIIHKNFNKKPTVVPGMIPKTLHMDMAHISRYQFEGSVDIQTDTIIRILSLLIQLKVTTEKSKDKAYMEQIADDLVKLVTNIDDGPKNMALTYDLAMRLGVKLDIFDGKIFRILDINRWNTFEQAEQHENHLKEELLQKRKKNGSMVTEDEKKWLYNYR